MGINLQLGHKDIVETVGVSSKTFRNWRELGVVIPARGGQRKGDHDRYTIMQAVGIAVVCELIKSDRGCKHAYAKRVVDAFSSVSEDWLQGKLSKGRFGFTGICRGKPEMGGWAPSQEFPHVGLIYSDIILRVRTIHERLSGSQYGRPRGLSKTTDPGGDLEWA